MPTECNPNLFGFAPEAGRAVVGAFDGRTMPSDADARLRAAIDRVPLLTCHGAAWVKDSRAPARIEHKPQTLIMKRVTGSPPCQQR